MKVRPAEVVEGRLVTLRRCGVADLRRVHRLVEESLPHLRPWLAWAVDDYTEDDTAAFIAECESGWMFRKAFSYLILADGEPVGIGSLGRSIGPGGLELGYWLHPGHTGRGFATEAAAMLVTQAFALPGIERVQIWHDAANTASAAIPRRLGFSEKERRTPPRDPVTSGEAGIDVVWQLDRSVPT